MPNFVQVATLTDQTILATPRYAGQIIRIGTTDYVGAGAGVPIRAYGTGAAYLGEGYWDNLGIFAGNYTGPFFSGGDTDSATEQYDWSGTANASTSTLQTRVIIDDGAASRWNITDYSVVEDSTPIDPSDMSGGFGQITIGLPDVDIAETMNQVLVLTDGSLGETTGTIRSMGGDGLRAQVVANSRLGNLAVERTIMPFSGTLTDCIEYHLGLCGITSGIVIDTDFDAVMVNVPGGRENVYDRMLQLGAAYGFEMSLVSNNVVIRHFREREAINYRNAEVNWSMDQSRMAQSVTGWYYNTYYDSDGVAYPIQGVDADMDVFQVDDGETKVYEIVMDASLSSVEAPAPVDGGLYASTVTSAYAISTMDGETIDPGEWTTTGGSLVVEISEDRNVLKVTVRGADIPEKAPFRIAVPSGQDEFTSALRIRGDGVFWKREQMILEINEDVDRAPDEVGADVDSKFMETADQLYHRLLHTAARYGTDRQTISVQTGGINRLGETGSARYATIGDVNAAYPGATIGSIFTALGPTIADWNAATLALVSGDFSNQAFGNVNGARVRYNHSYYRIRAATLTARDVKYDAERDNTIGDVYYYGETIAQWNARWAGKTIRDVNIAPLIEKDAI